MPELNSTLQSEWDIYKERHTSHVHLKIPIAGIALTDSWLKLTLDETNYTIKTFGGFSFDDANDRIYWDSPEVIGRSLPAFFVGDAGIQVTAGIGAGVTISMGLFFDDILILETPMTFLVTEKIQGYGANGVLVDVSDVNLLQSGSYYDIRAKAATGQTPTVTLDYLNVTIKRD